jgi:uncharacterized protein with beta-barrel porin domain
MGAMMKNLLLGSTALVCLSLAAVTAQAACAPTTTPTTGQSVDCTGTSTTPILAGANQNNITITLENGARLNTAAVAIKVNGDNSIHLLGDAQINTTGNTSHGIYTVNDNNTIDLNGTSRITTAGSHAYGVALLGNRNSLTLNGTTANISTTGTAGNAVVVYGNDDSITLNDTTKLQTTGTGAAGVFGDYHGARTSVTLNGQSSITTTGNDSIGLYLEGIGSSVTLNGASQISTAGTNASGVIVTGGQSQVQIIGTLNNHGISTTGANARGAILADDNNSLLMSGTSFISTTGAGSHAIELNGSHNVIQLTGDDSVVVATTGANSDDIHVRGGTNNTISMSGTARIQSGSTNAVGINVLTNSNTILLNTQNVAIDTIGANSDDIRLAGNSNIVRVTGATGLITSGATAHGINLTGNSNRADLFDNSTITTTGNTASAIQFAGSSNFVFLRGASAVRAEGTGSFGADFSAGGSNILDLEDSASIRSDQAAAIHTVAGSNFNDIFLNGASTVTADAANVAAIQLNSDFNILETSGTSAINAGGANAIGLQLNNANNSLVTLSGQSSINTTGANSTTILVQGTDNQLGIQQQARVTATGANATAISLSGALNSLRNRGTVSASGGIAILGDNNGANSDDIINNGVISSGGGNAPISLRAGDDSLALGTGSQISGGAIDGGAGNDTLKLFGHSSEDDTFTNFETLRVIADLDNLSATDWSLSGNSTFATAIDVQNGRLRVNGTLTSPATTVRDAGILGGSGTLTSNVTSTGHIAPGNSVGTLTINGNFTQTGGAFDVETDSHGVDRLNVLGAAGATLAGGPALNIIPLDGNTGGAGIILHAPNGITGSFGTVNFDGNGAVDLVQTATDISLITVDGTPVVAGDFAATEAGLDYLDSVGDEQLAGVESCGTDTCDRAGDQRKHLWAKAFGRFGNEAASAGNQAFDFRIAGTAMGGDMVVSNGLRLGAAFGYSNTEENVTKHAASADINTTQLGLYANYQKGPYFVTGLVSGGWQSFDLSRQVGGGGAGEDEADASTHGWLFGSSLQAGAQFRFPKGWMLTPSAGVSYQHQWVNGTTEHGGGAADVDIAGHQSDAVRLKAQLVLSQDYQLTNYTITPHLKVGVQQQFNLGGKADGTFSDGTDFALDLIKTDRTIGVIGLGVGFGFQNGLSTYVDYDGAMASGRTVHSITGGLRYSW